VEILDIIVVFALQVLNLLLCREDLQA